MLASPLTHRLELPARSALVVAAAALVIAGVPAAVTTAVSLPVVVVTAERVARYRRHGVLDLALFAVGGPVLAAIVLGFVLNALPGGLTTPSWAVGAAVVQLAALACCAGRPVPPSALQLVRSGARRPSVWGVACGVLGTAVVTASIAAAVVTARSTAPAPLALSATSVSDGKAVIRVDAGAEAVRLQVVLTGVGGGPAHSSVLVPRLDLPPGGSTTFVAYVPPGTRSTLELRTAGRPDAVRTLVFDGDTVIPEGN